MVVKHLFGCWTIFRISPWQLGSEAMAHRCIKSLCLDPAVKREMKGDEVFLSILDELDGSILKILKYLFWLIALRKPKNCIKACLRVFSACFSRELNEVAPF